MIGGFRNRNIRPNLDCPRVASVGLPYSIFRFYLEVNVTRPRPSVIRDQYICDESLAGDYLSENGHHETQHASQLLVKWHYFNQHK